MRKSYIITAKIFSNTGYESQKISKTLNGVNEKYRTMQRYNLKLHFVQGLAVTILISAMLALLIVGRMHGTVSIGDFVFVLTLSGNIVSNVWSLGQDLVNFTRDVGKCQNALSLISIPHDIEEQPNASTLQVSHGNISFNQVNFDYLDGSQVFSDFSVQIPSGQKVGLVGFSGGGKSTFVSLILRLYDVNSGSITIDDQIISQVTLDSLRKNIAYIPQEPELFHRSLMENIRYGCLDASDEDVVTASKKAHCHEFIEQLKTGYDTLVGERGIKLSGGQRQRIAIARAFLKQAPILILDEATSALDSITEKYIQESLHLMMQNKTTIVIAHRLSTLKEMDRILVFQDGHIIEDGSQSQLLEAEGQFSDLWKMQSGGFV